MKKYTHISYKEMVQIETLLNEGFTVSEIAIKLGRGEATIYRKIKDAEDLGEKYNANLVWDKIRKRKRKANTHYRILDNSLLSEYVLTKIESYWSPEQIAKTWKKKTNESLSHETIYNYVYRKHPELIKLYFRRKGKRYRRDRDTMYNPHFPPKKSIDERPATANNRKEFGHWEGDLIVGPVGTKPVIITNVERQTGFLIASKSPNKTAIEVSDLSIQDFKDLPDEMKLSITYDNGKEFEWYEDVERLAKISVYFARAYAPWQRGTNENTNGLLRQFIPKGTDISTISEEELQNYVDLINHRPRKRHDWESPHDLYHKKLINYSKSLTS